MCQIFSRLARQQARKARIPFPRTFGTVCLKGHENGFVCVCVRVYWRASVRTWVFDCICTCGLPLFLHVHVCAYVWFEAFLLFFFSYGHWILEYLRCLNQKLKPFRSDQSLDKPLLYFFFLFGDISPDTEQWFSNSQIIRE